MLAHKTMLTKLCEHLNENEQQKLQNVYILGMRSAVEN